MNTRTRNNNRNSGRFNTPGQFVPAAETQQQNYGTNVKQESKIPAMNTNLQQIPTQDTDVQMESVSQPGEGEERPKWMKTKLQGVKKVSNKEKRRRQNQTLRRLLTPKNALMILNEMVPHEQVANQFKVEANSETMNFYNKTNIPSFAAELSLYGANYKGFGENKLSARNAAAEQAIRDIILKKMHKVLGSEGGDDEDEESLPMIQLASFALHKLFAEWEYSGHKVPQLCRHSTSSVSEAGAGAGGAAAEGGAVGGAAGGAKGGAKGKARVRTVPANAGAMHPCMLLTYLRPHLEYVDLPPQGDKPQNILFSIQLRVDGQTFLGKASSKKEARKEAARQACQALFGVVFDEHVTATAPLHH